MSVDCLIVANSNTTTGDRRERFLASNDLKSRWRFGLGLLKRSGYQPWRVARISGEIRRVQRELERQESLLIEERPRNWGATDVVNYVRAGRTDPIITRTNSRRYITWLDDITLNGVILLDYLARHALSGERIQTFGFESDDRVDRLLGPPASSATCPVNAKIPAPIITPVPIATVPGRLRLPLLYWAERSFIRQLP